MRLPLRRFATHAWGAAENGQLGLPPPLLTPELDTYGQTSPHPQPIPALAHYKLTHVSASASHSAFVRADGTLFTCGFNSHGQLGRPGDEHEPQRVDVSNVTRVACGGRHTLALDAHGVVHAFGSNERGQLGGDGGIVRTLIDGGHRVVDIAAGDDFSVAVCSEGRVLSWGGGGEGRLGHGRVEGLAGVFSGVGERLPRVVRGLDGVKIGRVFAGNHHVVGVDGEGRAFAWGCGRHFQLGTGDEGDRWEPVEGFCGLRVDKVSMGGMHSLILGGGGVWGVGMNEHGCLGLDVGVREVREVVRVGEGVDCAAGWGVSAVVRGGRVWMWGCGLGGALGIGDRVDVWRMVDVGVRARGVEIGAGGRSVLAYE